MKLLVLTVLIAIGMAGEAHALVECRYGTTEDGVPFVSIVSGAQFHARVGYRNHEERNEALRICQNKALIQCSISVRRVQVIPADGEGIKYSRYQNETVYSHETFETLLGYRAGFLDRTCTHHGTLESCESSSAAHSLRKLEYLTDGFEI